METIPRLLTIGRIAAEEGEQVRRIQYVLSTRPHIKPVALAGNARLFDSAAVQQIRDALDDIDSRRSRPLPQEGAVPC